MNQHNITNESLGLSMILVVVAILISHRESWRWKRTLSGASAARWCS